MSSAISSGQSSTTLVTAVGAGHSNTAAVAVDTNMMRAMTTLLITVISMLMLV